MGWFGSLDLAYKYAIVLGILFFTVFCAGFAKVLYNRRKLKQFTKNASLEASGTNEERVELNKRELDEGDLFGVRAIESGYFGGVAQSRPTSAAGSLDGSGTLLGHPSPKLPGTSPMSSVVSLPLEPRHSSPLAKNATSSSDASTSTRKVPPPPLRSTLQPSEAELNGRVNHDPAVNMNLEIPPSPLATPSRPMSSQSDISVQRPLSSAFPFPTPPRAEQNIQAEPPQIALPENVRSSARMSTVQHADYEVHSQSASIVSKTSDRDSGEQERGRSPYQDASDLPAPPARTARWERPTSNGMVHPPRSSSIPRGAPEHLIDRLRHEDVPMPNPPRISAVGDWGPAIFQEINDSLQDSKSIASNPPHESENNDNEPNNNSQHNSHLSDSSSVYSVANVATRYTSKQIPEDRRSVSQALAPGLAESNHKNTLSVERTRRGSDASSHLQSQPPSGDGSRAGSGTNSHRHTKEINDLYDSYWRQSRDVQPAGSSRPSRESSRGPGHSDEMGRSSTHGPVNSRGEVGKERRPGQLEVKVATIEEVPTPIASPIIGKAM